MKQVNKNSNLHALNYHDDHEEEEGSEHKTRK